MDVRSGYGTGVAGSARKAQDRGLLGQPEGSGLRVSFEWIGSGKLTWRKALWLLKVAEGY